MHSSWVTSRNWYEMADNGRSASETTHGGSGHRLGTSTSVDGPSRPRTGVPWAFSGSGSGIARRCRRCCCRRTRSLSGRRRCPWSRGNQTRRPRAMQHDGFPQCHVAPGRGHVLRCSSTAPRTRRHARAPSRSGIYQLRDANGHSNLCIRPITVGRRPWKERIWTEAHSLLAGRKRTDWSDAGCLTYQPPGGATPAGWPATRNKTSPVTNSRCQWALMPDWVGEAWLTSTADSLRRRKGMVQGGS
jgi:hypothetical protein